MNITELARRLKTPTRELKEKLPLLGFDIGQKAIKVDNRTAEKIMKDWPEWQRQQQELARLEQEKIIQEKKETGQLTKVALPSILTVREFAAYLELPINQVIKELMKNGIMASLNERIDYDTATIVAEDLGFKISPITENTDEIKFINDSEKIKNIMEQEKDKAMTRPPIVVIMGHVDHGKTKLLDAIRKTNVIDTESGKITQHIGAYQVTKKNKKITFIDTPGHEAFTAIRSRGAKVADIAILVIAAEDGFKPQTEEALKIIQSNKLPVIVAINKIDKPEANIEKVKQELSQHNLLPEDWGGKTICVPISAKQNQGIDELLEIILLVADMEKDNIRSNPNIPAIGTIIESHIDRGEGPVATILIQAGTLKQGDFIIIDNVTYGKVRLMKNWRNQIVTKATPAMPVKILGLKKAPQVGDIAEATQELSSIQKKTKVVKTPPTNQLPVISKTNIEQTTNEEEDKIQVLNVIIKGDTLGSVEAIIESLEKIELPDDIKIKIVAHGLGNITEADILKAQATKSLILGFNIQISPAISILAQENKVAIKNYTVIYHLIEEIKNNLRDLLATETKINELGKIKILAIFRTEKDKMIVGGRITTGKVLSQAKIRVIRNEYKIGLGKIDQLQIDKNEVNEAVEGQECGLRFIGKPIIAIGDTLEVYQEETRERTLGVN